MERNSTTSSKNESRITAPMKYGNRSVMRFDNAIIAGVTPVTSTVTFFPTSG